jgi:hypothetical protein
MKKLIVAALVAGVASLASVKSVQAQEFYPGSVPARVNGNGVVYPGTYPAQYPNQYPTAEHARHKRKHERRDNDGDAEDARYGTYGGYGQYGTYGTYGNYGTYGYPSTGVPARVDPGAGYGVYSVPSRRDLPQQQVHSHDRDRDGRRTDRDR